MAITLPTAVVKKTRISPKISLFYGLPKVGKTGKMAELSGNLILDGEEGAEVYDCLRVTVRSTADIDDVYNQIMGQAIDFKKKNPDKKAEFPYKYITVDTADKLEEFCERSATAKYKKSTIGNTFKGESVLELPNGGGYYYLRNEVIEKIEMLAKVCDRLIIIAHVKDKLVTTKKGEDVTVKDISLTGRLAGIVCAKADAIGYMFRNPEDGGNLWVSFETYDGSVMGARPEHLAGKKMPMDWDKIFID